MNTLDHYIFKQNYLSKSFCEDLTKEIDQMQWEKHQWYGATGKYHSEKEQELDVLKTVQHPQLREKIVKPIVSAIKDYQKLHGQSDEDRTKEFIYTISPVRFNKYSSGTKMRKHFDHIRDLFDGNFKGIPILSVVGVLNDNYEGGEFVFNNDYEVKLKQGDILIFPSNFIYAHEVKEIKNGTRYSYVSWGF